MAVIKYIDTKHGHKTQIKVTNLKDFSQIQIDDWYCEHSLQYIPKMNGTEPDWREVQPDSGKGFVVSILTHIKDAIGVTRPQWGN